MYAIGLWKLVEFKKHKTEGFCGGFFSIIQNPGLAILRLFHYRLIINYQFIICGHLCSEVFLVLFLYEFWTHFLSDLKISLITMRYLEWPKSLQKKRSKRHSLKNQSRYFLCKFHVIPNNFQGTCIFIWLIIFHSLMW